VCEPDIGVCKMCVWCVCVFVCVCVCVWLLFFVSVLRGRG